MRRTGLLANILALAKNTLIITIYVFSLSFLTGFPTQTKPCLLLFKLA